MKGARRLCFALFLAGWLVAGAAAADEEGWGYRLAHDVMSPYCPGRTLAECPSPQADELRVWILTQEAAGATRAEVEAMLYDQFGERLRQAPLAEGWGLTAYIVPVLAALAAAGLIAVFLRRSAGPKAGRGAAAGLPFPAATPADPELERLLDEELQRP